MYLIMGKTCSKTETIFKGELKRLCIASNIPCYTNIQLKRQEIPLLMTTDVNMLLHVISGQMQMINRVYFWCEVSIFFR